MRMQAIRSAKHAQMTPTSRRGLSFILLGWVGSTARGGASSKQQNFGVPYFHPSEGVADVIALRHVLRLEGVFWVGATPPSFWLGTSLHRRSKASMAGSIFATRPETAPVPHRKPPAKAQSVEKVMVILRNFFEQRPNSVLLGCFREQDADGSGQLELPEFTRALQSLNINLSDADIAGVFAALDSDGGGILELKEFLNELKSEPDPREARWLRLGIGHQYIEPNREPPSTLGVKNEPWLSGFNRGNRVLVDGDKSIPEPKRDETVVDIGDSGDGAETALTLLRDFFSRRSVASLLTLFQDVDQDDSGQIDVDEFGTALRQLNMHLSQEDIQGLFNYFDQDHSGVCEVREILAMLKAEPTPEEARWQRIGIGKQTLTPTRDVHIKVPPYYPTYRTTLPYYFTTIRDPTNLLLTPRTTIRTATLLHFSYYH